MNQPRKPIRTLEEALRRGEPLFWKDRLRQGLPLLPIAGGANVTSNLTNSGLAHIDGLFTLTTPSPAKQWEDMSGMGHGAHLVPVRISFGHDRPLGSAYSRICPYRARGYLDMGLPMRGGSHGANVLADGTEVMQTYVPASWREPIGRDAHDAQAPPSNLTQYVRLDADLFDSFPYDFSLNMPSPWHESEVAATGVLVPPLLFQGTTVGAMVYWDADIPQDHFAELELSGVFFVQHSGPAVRITFGSTYDNFTGYVAFHDDPGLGGVTFFYRLYKLVNFDLQNGTLPAPMASFGPIPYAQGGESGSIIRIQAVGNRISVLNEKFGEVIAVTDASPLIGTRVGAVGRGGELFSSEWTMFRGGLAGGGIPTGERFGTPQISTTQTVSPSSIASAEAFGMAKVNLNVNPSAIPSAEAFGASRLNLNINPSGIPTGEAFGSHRINLNILAGGLASGESFGAHRIDLRVLIAAIASGEAFGMPQVTVTGGAAPQTVSPVGIATGEAFGSHQVSLPLPIGEAKFVVDKHDTHAGSARGTMDVDSRDRLKVDKRDL